MSEHTEIYICLNKEERGPFDSKIIDRMLQEGSIRLSDQAWRPGLADWTTLEEVLRPAPTEPEEATLPPAEPATAKQKAFLSYMGVPLPPDLSKERAALLVNDAMENPSEPARLARWAEERLRLHPELFAADLQARKENRPNFFYEQVIREGAECFHDVSKAHCQVLVGFLDVKFPNWDARESEAAWDYFFPAIAEKFPQLVNRAWRGRLKYPHGPRVAAELGHAAPGRGAFRHPGQLLSPRALVFGTLILAAGIGALYLHRHPVNWAKLTAPQSHGPAMVFAGASPTPAEPAGMPSPPAETFAATGNSAEPPADGSSPMSDPGPTTDSGMATKDPGDGMLASAKPTTGGSMEAAPAAPMAATPEMAATPPADAPPAGSTPGLFKPPGAATPATVTTGLPAATPRKAVLLTKAIAVQTAYGKVTIAPGTVLKIVGKDSETVKISYMNTIVTVPIASTDLEP